jgi:hypothetical protein
MFSKIASAIHGHLESEFQRQLYESWIANVLHLSEGTPLVGNIAIDAIELRVIPHVENISAEFHLQSFT